MMVEGHEAEAALPRRSSGGRASAVLLRIFSATCSASLCSGANDPASRLTICSLVLIGEIKDILVAGSV
jgi:hypothetical protein